MYLYMLHEGEKLGASNRSGKKALIFCPKFSFLNKCLTILGSYSVRFEGTASSHEILVSRCTPEFVTSGKKGFRFHKVHF